VGQAAGVGGGANRSVTVTARLRTESVGLWLRRPAAVIGSLATMGYTPPIRQSSRISGERLTAGPLAGDNLPYSSSGNEQCAMTLAEPQAALPEDEALDGLINAAEKADEAWWNATQSDGDDCVVLGLHLYLDDSGSDDPSPLVTIGGPAMTRIKFRNFSTRWQQMLAKHRIDPPLHMTEFIGRGKYVTMFPEMKRALFLDATKLINTHKEYSVSVAVSQDGFRNELSEDVRKTLIGPYAFAFFTVVTAHQTMSMHLLTGPLKCAYVVDSGIAFAEQLVAAHSAIVRREKAAVGSTLHTGGLAFQSDVAVPALQAADVIAWASRKRELDGLPEGFEPLAELFAAPSHRHLPMPTASIGAMADPINRWLERKGALPSLDDIIKA
jgi:Protein of unknown function (DUF3800)